MLEVTDNNIESVLGIMVPIVAIVGGISYAIVNRYLRSKERMEMISKGMDVSKLSQEYDNSSWQNRRRNRSPLRSGLSLLGIGSGLLLAFIFCNTILKQYSPGVDHTIIYIGFVCVFWGIARLLTHMLEPKDNVNP